MGLHVGNSRANVKPLLYSLGSQGLWAAGGAGRFLNAKHAVHATTLACFWHQWHRRLGKLFAIRFRVT